MGNEKETSSSFSSCRGENLVEIYGGVRLRDWARDLAAGIGELPEHHIDKYTESVYNANIIAVGRM